MIQLHFEECLSYILPPPTPLQRFIVKLRELDIEDIFVARSEKAGNENEADSRGGPDGIDGNI